MNTLICLGMTDAQVGRCRKRLVQFLADLLEPVGRTERRHWGGVYVRSLLLDGERKSIEPLAARLPEGNVQAMQQFIGQSPWEWAPVWERLERPATARSQSAFIMLENKGMHRWDGGCTCRRVGSTIRSDGARRGFRRTSSFVRSGNWRWKSLIRYEAGVCRIE